jgi:hypothetical protein
MELLEAHVSNTLDQGGTVRSIDSCQSSSDIEVRVCRDIGSNIGNSEGISGANNIIKVILTQKTKVMKHKI